MRSARVEVEPIGAELTGGTGQSNFEGIPAGHYRVVATREPLCPAEAEVRLGPGQSVELTLDLVRRIDLGMDRAQVGFGSRVLIEARVGCGSPDVDWEVVSGDVALVSFEGTVATVWTRPLDEAVDLDSRFGVVPISMSGAQHVVLRASVGEGSSRSSDDVRVSAAVRSGGIFVVAVGADTYLNGPGAAEYDWRLDEQPPSSVAQIASPSSRTPWLRPDEWGTYIVREAVSGERLELQAGKYNDVPQDCGRHECHPEEAGTFLDTGHASTFARALKGELGPGFDEDCTLCHATGVDPLVFMGGFDDVARAVSYELQIPSSIEDMPTALRELASVWCTACHGPARIVTDAAGWERGAKFRAEVCAQCHEGEHGAPARVSEWRLAKMSRFIQGLTEGDPALERGCARCHSAQGFVSWMTTGELARLADARAVEPVTCVACHDPHGSEFPARLRVWDAQRGSTALCVTCHRSQSSIEEPLVRAARQAPHAPQGDMVLVPGNPHGNRFDACVGCHMAGSDATVGGHTFAMRDAGGAPNQAACAGCHAGARDFGVPAAGDWDGDGNREAAVDEYGGLMLRLEAEVAEAATGAWVDACGGRFASGVGHSMGRIVLTDTLGGDLGDCDGDGKIEAAAGEAPAMIPADRDDLYEVAHILVTQRLDRSRGIHDPRGQPRSLQRAIARLSRAPLPPWDIP